jgi:hypothetical protein
VSVGRCACRAHEPVPSMATRMVLLFMVRSA